MAAIERTIKIKVDSSGAKSKIDNLDYSMKNLESSADKTNKSFNNLKTAVIAVAAALQVRQISQYADAFTSIQNQIRQTTKTTEELSKRTFDLLEISKRSRTEFGATAELYTQLTLATENLNLSTEEQLRLTETIGKSFSVSGASAQASAGAIRQLGQAFGSGALRGDEFNSIAEGAPEIMRALQRSLKLTQGELRDLAADGGITSKVLVEALTKAADVIDKKMATSTKTLAQSYQEAESNAIAFIGASDLVTGAMKATGDSIVYLSENLDKIANVLLVAAILGVSRLSAAIILNTVETVKNTVAKTANNKIAFAYNATTMQSIALTTASTVATRAATVAMTGLRGAMAFLGGPVGIILTVASAFLIFNTRQDETKEATERTTKAIAEQTDKIKNMDQALRDIEMKKLSDEQNELLLKIKQTNEEIKKLEKSLIDISKSSKGTGFSFVSGMLDTAREKLAGFSNELSVVQAKLNTTFEAGTGEIAATSTGGESDAAGKKGRENPAADEKFKTQSLRDELNARIELRRKYNELVLIEFNSLFEEERALAEYNKQAELIELDLKRQDLENDYMLKREQLLINTELDAAAKKDLLAELNEQEILAKQIFEQDKLDIERRASEESVAITEAEEQMKRDLREGAWQAAIDGLSIFGKKASKIQQSLAIINAVRTGYAAAIEAWNAGMSTGGPYAPLVAAAYTAASIAKTSAIISKIKDSGKSMSSVGGGTSSVNVGQQQAERQEPIERRTIVENRGLAEVANAIKNLDPSQVLPVEYTQRIVLSLEQYNRLSGAN